MTLEERIKSFSELGKILRDSLEGIPTGCSSEIEDLINNQQYINPWFTPGNVRMAIKAIAAINHSTLFFKALEPIRYAAKRTIATTAGLIPYRAPATAGTVP